MASKCFLVPYARNRGRSASQKKTNPISSATPAEFQVFVRGPAGVAEFNRLLKRTNNDGLLTRLKQMEERYRLTCPECGREFWIEPELIKTSTFDGSVKGFRCPQKDCDAVAPWEE